MNQRALRPALLLLGLVSIGALPACGSETPSDEWLEVARGATSAAPSCQGERAVVPRSGATARTITGENARASRQEQAGVYVAFQVNNQELFAYFSFAPELPSNPSTDQVRALLKYAYVDFSMKQPSDVGGSLTLLSSNQLLKVTDFERFEVQDGQLSWRLVRRSDESYSKRLSIYDEDVSNDPAPGSGCVTDDIVGMCYCPFEGLPVTVTIDGTTSLSR